MSNGQTSAKDRNSGGTVEDLSRHYGAVLLRYFVRRGVDAQDAADLAQEVFARLSDDRQRNRIENAEGYLFACAANIAMDYFRRRKVRHDHVRQVRHLECDDQDFSPEQLVAGRQELDAVVAALNEMPERMRNIFILARLENLPRAEIAARLGISKSLVEQQITLATACLADRRRRLR